MHCFIYSHYGNLRLGSRVDVLGWFAGFLAGTLISPGLKLSQFFGFCLCLFPILDKVGSGSHYTHQRLPCACLGLVELWTAGIWGFWAHCLGGVSVPLGMSAAHPWPSTTRVLLEAMPEGIPEPFPSGPLPQVDLAPSTTAQIKPLGAFGCRSLSWWSLWNHQLNEFIFPQSPKVKLCSRELWQGKKRVSLWT